MKYSAIDKKQKTKQRTIKENLNALFFVYTTNLIDAIIATLIYYYYYYLDSRA